MKLAVDLHSHSGYAGGVGQIELNSVSATMKLKGIDVFGTGDCLFPRRTKELKEQLTETGEGLFSLPNDPSKFLLQTEVIFTVSLTGYKNKIIAHHVILFPDFESIAKADKLMKKWKMKNTIGRPFITCEIRKQLEERLFCLKNIHPNLEIIPAHVMTPDGIYGSKNNLSELSEFYGDFLPNIRVIETGLSADPQMLEKIPDLSQLTMISNSDCHSAALNRIGREFTILETDNVSYKSIIDSLRQNKVVLTAEFNPAEGRYYNTGHRANRTGHTNHCIYSASYPEDLLCPECNKKMLLGVKQRGIDLSDTNCIPLKRNFIHLIPLTEVIAHSLNVKSVSSKKVLEVFNEIMKHYPSEIALWQSEGSEVLLDKRVPEKTITQISAVRKGQFSFEPAGYDGVYGNLKIGD
jgi:DNA helicase II / ATP-dependent DNA helicase PcrA